MVRTGGASVDALAISKASERFNVSRKNESERGQHMRPRNKKVLAKGRRAYKDHPSYAMLPTEVLTSPACKSIPHYALRTLAAIACTYHGANNGDLSITSKRAEEHGI